jgi:PAS domain S-box-containing protein
MSALFRFMDWPLRAKMAALLAVASLLPLAIAAIIDIREAQDRLLENSAALLAARGDQLLSEFDAFHRGYQLSVTKLARLPDVVGFSQARRDNVDRLKAAVGAILEVHAASDANLRGLAVLDLSGTVKIATEDRLVGKNLAYHGYVREGLRGAAVISDVHLAEPEAGYAPTIAYLAPVPGVGGKMNGLAVLWVRAKSLWDIAKASNELAGPRSFAVVFDRHGIRIAHTYSEDIVFHPGGALAPATIDALVAERRFGEKTRVLLEDVRAFPEQFDRARSESSDRGLFRGFAPVNQAWNYGVARRLETAPWTIFYMIPEEFLSAQIAQTTRDKTVFASAIILIALIAGTLFAAVILRPVRSLSTATAALAGGDLAARVQVGRADELGRLGMTFNSMAGRIETQATALQRARDKLELRVQERTAELVQTTQDLEVEVVERKRAEESLATTLNSIGDAVIATDMEGCVARMNPVAEQLTGWPLEEAKGRPLGEVFRILNEDTRRPVESPVARVLREGVVVGLANHTILISRDGTEQPIADSGAPIRDPTGEISGVVLVFRDRTEERRMEEMRVKSLQLEAQSLRIQEANRMKSEFLANMSHELRTPLNGIIGFSEFLFDEKPGKVNAKQKEYLEDILNSGRHLLQLINDVLDLSKVEAGKMELSPETFALPKAVEDVCSVVAQLAKKKKIAIRRAIGSSIVEVTLDRQKFKQVLFNLLSNAVKFTDDGGQVDIIAGPHDPGLLKLQVRDTGIGIKPEDIGKLFAQFQQLDSSLARRHQGTGLGLALTRKIVELQKGTIAVESEPGKGSTFTVILPLSAEKILETSTP